MKFSKHKPVAIRYYDHTSDDSYLSDGECDLKPMTITSIGWVVVDHKDYVVLALNFYNGGDDLQTSTHMCIIKSTILSHQELTLDKLK